MTTANKLTILRVLMIPAFLVVLYWGFPVSRYVALGIYIVACLTDLLDGYIARHYNQVSDFGKFMDPLADKCLVMAALCWFVEEGTFFAWVLAIVLLREFGGCGEGARHCRRLVGKGQDRQYYGVYLPDPAGYSSGVELCMPGYHFGDNGVLRS